jgi:hypothetical protein
MGNNLLRNWNDPTKKVIIIDGSLKENTETRYRTLKEYLERPHTKKVSHY